MRKLTEFDYKNKRVFLRVDLNVPILAGKILDDTRINKIIPTIQYLQKAGARITLASHFGRPKSKADLQFSLEFLKEVLSKKIGCEVIFSSQTIGEQAQNLANSVTSKQILLLENLRFNSGETSNDSIFASELAKLADFYVNDAFSCSHRAHASIDKITEYLPSATGLLLTEELESLSRYLLAPKQPMLAIIGGSKISTKITLIQSLMNQADYVVIGGAMANTLLKSKGYSIGASLCEDDFLEFSKNLTQNPKLILPIDVVIADSFSGSENIQIVDIDNVPAGKYILDIGPKSIANISKILEQCATLVMNGPLGVFENPNFAIGTNEIAKKIATLTNLNKLISIAGGGDTIAALTLAGALDQFTYVSTAGGAFLEWLENKKLVILERS